MGRPAEDHSPQRDEKLRWAADLLSRELAVELLDLRHQIGIKPSDLDASIPETEFPATTDRIVRIEHAEDERVRFGVR